MAATVLEYHYEAMDTPTPRPRADWEAVFEELGKSGWEYSGSLTAEDGEFLVFKRASVGWPTSEQAPG